MLNSYFCLDSWWLLHGGFSGGLQFQCLGPLSPREIDCDFLPYYTLTGCRQHGALPIEGYHKWCILQSHHAVFILERQVCVCLRVYKRERENRNVGGGARRSSTRSLGLVVGCVRGLSLHCLHPKSQVPTFTGLWVGIPLRLLRYLGFSLGDLN